MAEMVGFAEAFAAALAEVAAVLDERARRLLMGAGARQLGCGGIKLIAAATGASADTVGRGAAELEAGIVADGRVRAKGAGRKPVEHHDPGLWPALDKLVDPETRGDPMSRLRWTTKSTVRLAEELSAQGHEVGPNTVARLLKDHDYSLQGNAKTIEGKQHPDRDAQFRYLNDQVTAFLVAGIPVISVDTKKKENVGAYKNGGRVTSPRVSRCRPTPTTSSVRGARQCLTGCMTWARTPGGSTWAPTPTPECSRSSRSAAGGAPSGGSPTRRQTDC